VPLTLTLTYDALGRLTQEANAVGTFGYGYGGPTARLTFGAAQSTSSFVEG
jgi:hypothetical protein